MGRSSKASRRAREELLRIVYAAELARISAEHAYQSYESCFVGEVPPPGPTEATPWYRIERFEDELPSTEAWASTKAAISDVIERLDRDRAAIDNAISTASPRWRLERMPVVDRALLIIGAAEMIRSEPAPLRPVFHDLIELAKAYGSDSTPRFVNGILDQMRKDLRLPFS